MIMNYERVHSSNLHTQPKSPENRPLGPLKVESPSSYDAKKEPVLPSRKVLKPTTNLDRAFQYNQLEGSQQQKKTTKQRKKERSSNLVNDRLVPSILKDDNRHTSYIKNECVGLGGFAKVYRVANEHGKVYAAKVVAKASLLDQKRKEKLIAEINIHRSLCHEYIVQYQSCFEDKYNVYIILEYCRNQTLNTLLSRRKKVTEDEVRYFMGQLLSAVRYISDNRIVHRDIKLGNVFLDENMDCKIGDFGLSARLVNKTTCGTPHYIAPEILFDSTGHNHRADMWSSGVLMYTLLYGKHPFHHEERKKLYQIVKQNEDSTTFSFPNEGVEVTSDAKNLITSLLVNNPDRRLTVTQALGHPFFVTHKIPECMPQEALYRRPSHQDLYPSEYAQLSSQSKVADSVKQAADANESYVDRSIKPPLELLQEVILDHRTHFPIRDQEPSQITPKTTIPQTNIPTPKRKYSNNHSMSLSSKRLQSKAYAPDESLFTKDEPVKEMVTFGPSRKARETGAQTVHQQFKQTIMEEITKCLRMMLNRKGMKSTLTENERVGYRGKGDLVWGYENVFIQSWLDGTKKYGFCYCLSDDTLGVLFNDRSTLTTHDEKHFYCVSPQESTGQYLESVYSVSQLSIELEKKRFILDQFKLYMKSNLAVEYNTPKATHATGVHVMKYAVDESAISFKLSNGVLQFNFFNHKKLVLYDGGRKLIFIGENKQLYHQHTIDMLYSENLMIINCLKDVYQSLVSQNELHQEALRTERWKRYEKLSRTSQ